MSSGPFSYIIQNTTWINTFFMVAFTNIINNPLVTEGSTFRWMDISLVLLSWVWRVKKHGEIELLHDVCNLNFISCRNWFVSLTMWRTFYNTRFRYESFSQQKLYYVKPVEINSRLCHKPASYKNIPFISIFMILKKICTPLKITYVVIFLLPNLQMAILATLRETYRPI